MSDINELAKNAACYAGIPAFLRPAVEIYLLARSANDMSTPSELAKAASCYCFGDKKVQESVLIYLLDQLVSSGGGSTCLIRLIGNGPPVVPPPCPLSIAASQGPNAGVWLGDSTTGVWEELIVPGP